MRDRQPYKNNPYYLPRTLYNQVIAIVRDYDRKLEKVNDVLYGNVPPPDGMPRGTVVGDPVGMKVEAVEAPLREIEAINRALNAIPEEYALYIFDNVRYGDPYPDIAHRNTWSKWRKRFLYQVARSLRYI